MTIVAVLSVNYSWSLGGESQTEHVEYINDKESLDNVIDKSSASIIEKTRVHLNQIITKAIDSAPLPSDRKRAVELVEESVSSNSSGDDDDGNTLNEPEGELAATNPLE